MMREALFMNKSKLKFQLSFSKSSENKIKTLYNMSPADEILMAVWLSDNTCSIFERRGFVISKDGFSWNYPAVAETTERKDSTKERVPRNSNFLSKSDIRFLGTEFRDVDSAGREDGKREIQLRISGTLFIFSFDCDIARERVVFLEHAISSNLANVFDTTEFEKIDDSYSFSFTLLTIKDFFESFNNTIKEKIHDITQKLQNNKLEKNGNKEDSSKRSIVKVINKTGCFFRHIVDFLTDLTLMFAVLVFVKPQLLMKDFLEGITGKISGLTFSFFYYDWGEKLPQEIIDKRNFIFIVLLGLYLILKIFISLSCRKNRKAVTALLLIMLTANFLLITDKFLVFFLFLLLLLLSIQFSMGFTGKVVGRKTVFFVITCLIGYFVLHVMLYENFADLLHAIIATLSLPVKWW